MATSKSYSPSNVIVTAFGHIVSGFAAGTLVKVSRDTPFVSDSVGSDGEVISTTSSDKRGAITLSLLQTSLSNNFFSAKQNISEALGKAQKGIVSVTDLSGTSLHYAAEAWLQGFPGDGGFAQAGDGVIREWVIRCAELKMFVGGNVL